jgi:hypothetical protein
VTTDLEVAQLREGLSTTWCLAVLRTTLASVALLLESDTYERLRACMSTYVDLEVCFLVEALVAVGNSALVTLSRFMSDLDLLFLLHSE